MKKKSIINAIAALTQMLITSLVGLILNKTIISTLGSNYNGINSAVSQIISTLLILEGGFSLASNVALFEPFGRKDYSKINGILSATKKRFVNIGIVAFVTGIILVCLYPLTISSDIPKWMIASLMLTSLVPVSYNLAFTMRYRVLILTDQKEFVISFMNAWTYLVGNGIAIYLIQNGTNLLVARLVIMFFLLVNYWAIAMYCKRKYRFALYNSEPDFEAIKGTKNVMIMKITSVVYSTVPIIAISTIPGIGTLLASVYAVYKSILAVVKDSLTSITNAPRLAFGALLSEGKSFEVKRLFSKYEMLTSIGISIIVGTTSLLLVPFVELYTRGVMDIDYTDTFLAIVLVITVVVEIYHIPSGQIIQMKGDFAVARKIQTKALIILVVCLVVGRIYWGFYGVVLSVLIAALSLAIMEIYYVSSKVLKRNGSDVLKNIMPVTLVCFTAGFIGLSNRINFDNYMSFVFTGLLSVIIIGISSLVVFYFTDKENLKELIMMIKRTVISRKY
jgi:hypothetical protein